MRTKSFDVPPQEILTKDSVTVTVDAVIYYKVRDANGKSYETDRFDLAESIIMIVKWSFCRDWQSLTW